MPLVVVATLAGPWNEFVGGMGGAIEHLMIKLCYGVVQASGSDCQSLAEL